MLLSAACSDDDDAKAFPQTIVEITDPEVIIPASGKTFGSTVIYSNKEWTLQPTSSQEWLEYTPGTGSADVPATAYFTLAENETYFDRSVNFELKAGGETQVISVLQKQKDAILLSNNHQWMSQEGGDLNVLAEANFEYDIKISSENAWIEYPTEQEAVGDHGIPAKNYTFKINASQRDEERSGFVVFSHKATERFDTLWVHQYQRDKLIFDKPVRKVPLDGATRLEVVLRANVVYDITMPTESWIRTSPGSRALQADRLYLDIDPLDITNPANPLDRSAVITVKDRNSDLVSTLTITQLELDYVNFKVSTENLGLIGGTVSAVLETNTTNYDFIIPEQTQGWLTQVGVPEDLGGGEFKYTFSVTENPAGRMPRKAVIVAKTNDPSIDVEDIVESEFTITQDGAARASEVEVLTALYEGLKGSSWDQTNKWEDISEGNLGNLPGVTTEPRGIDNLQRITKIYLTFPPKDGAILDPLIGHLEFIEELVIADKAVESVSGGGSGEIPSSIEDLSTLRVLKLNGSFTNIPAGIENLQNLEELLLNVKSTDDPKPLARLKNLKKLTFHSNFAGALSPDFGNLVNLEEFSLGSSIGRSKIASLPAEIGNWTKLKKFKIVADQLTDIPAELGNLTELEEISISYCYALKNINGDLSQLAKVKTFNLAQDTSLLGVPAGIGGMLALENINFTKCSNMAGSLPANIGDLKKLKTIEASDLKLNGEFPLSISNCTELTSIKLNGNALTGTLPSDLNKLTKLTTLSLQKNKLSGDIPSFSGMELLSILDLSHNEFDGDINYGFADLVNLTNLRLNNNKLKGSIPTDIFSMPVLQYLYLNDNQLTGGIPGEIQNIQGSSQSQVYFELQNNLLSGPLPDELANQSKIYHFDVSNNNLTGGLPAKLKTNNFRGNGATVDFRGNRFDGYVNDHFASELKGKNWGAGGAGAYAKFYFQDQQLGYEFVGLPTPVAN